MRINRNDLAAAAEQGVLEPRQVEPLWQFFQQQGKDQPRLQFSHLLYYLGGLMAIGAMSLFMTVAWELLGGWGILLLATLYMVLAIALTEYLLQHGLRIPAGLTAALAVALIPLAVYGLQQGLGLWPDDAVYRDYHHWVSWRWILMELATLAAACVIFWRYRLPFLLLPVAVTLWYLSMDLVPFLFDQALTWELRRDFSLWFGLGMLLVALGVDLRLGRQPDYAFWLFVFGMLAFWSGLSFRASDSEWAKFGYFAINLGLLFIGTALRRRVFVVFGGLGVASYLGYLSYQVFADSLWFPVVLSFAGLVVIGLGVLWQRYEQCIGARLRAVLPARLRQVIETGD